MRVKVGDTWYSGSDQPVMVQFTKQDRINIDNMLKNCTKYCMYPDNIAPETIKKWMDDET